MVKVGWIIGGKWLLGSDTGKRGLGGGWSILGENFTNFQRIRVLRKLQWIDTYKHLFYLKIIWFSIQCKSWFWDLHQENIFNLKNPFDILGDQVCGGWELGEALKETPNSLRDYGENVCCQKYKTAKTKLQKIYPIPTLGDKSNKHCP